MSSNLNFLFALLVVILIATVALASRGCGGPKVPKFIDPMLTFDEAVSRSAQSGKPVFAVVAKDGVPECDSFKRGALATSSVVKFLKANTEPVYIDATRADSHDTDTLALLSRLNVKEFPTVVLARRNAPQEFAVGDVSAKDLMAWLTEAVKPIPAK